MNYQFRKAIKQDEATIWVLLQQGIQRRKDVGSKQWQDGYPNLSTVQNDIEKSSGHVLSIEDEIAGYCAIIENDEPAYENIDGG